MSEIAQARVLLAEQELESKRIYHSTMRIFAAFVLVAFITRVFADGLPDLGDASQAVLTPQQERELGEKIMREVRADPSYLKDPELTQYLNDLGYRLVSASPDARQPFQFFAIQDNSVNAFALPGGYIGVHTGVLLASASESELASVLAHEIAHVTQHHLARMLASQKQTLLTSLAALAVAILASRSNSELSQAAIATAQASAIQAQLSFTREHEREADRIGLSTLEQAGFDPRAMAAFFDQLQKSTRLLENNAPAYLRTHPLTFERIADVQNRVQGTPYRPAADSLTFYLMRAKLRATQGPAKEAVNFFEDSLREKKYTSEAASRYGLVTALMRDKRYEPARRELALLQKLVPSNPLVASLAGRLAVAQGKPDEATGMYRAAVKSFPQHRALGYEYAEVLIANRKAEEALQIVSEQLQLFPEDSRLYELQAKGYAALGKRLLQHRAQAEAYVRLGSLPAAIEQLQIALRAGDGDFYQLSGAESRLRELRALDAENRASKN
jgi:beta-barrel assembly-enhancing protease